MQGPFDPVAFRIRATGLLPDRTAGLPVAQAVIIANGVTQNMGGGIFAPQRPLADHRDKLDFVVQLILNSRPFDRTEIVQPECQKLLRIVERHQPADLRQGKPRCIGRACKFGRDPPPILDQGIHFG